MATTKKPASKKAAKETNKQPGKKPAAKRAPSRKKKAEQPELLPAVVAQPEEAKQEAPKMGRPTDFNQEVADRICERISDGESLRSICRDEAMPAKATVFRWLGKHKDFEDQYTRARQEQAESLADEIVNISDEVGQPLIVEGAAIMVDGKPMMVVDNASVQHAKLRVEARKWVASKLKPKKYGDKIEMSGPNGGAIPLNVSGKVALTADEAYLRMLNGDPEDGGDKPAG
jgi:hypothetical protein